MQLEVAWGSALAGFDTYDGCLLLALAAAITDGFTGKIPNFITYPAMILGLAWWLFAGGIAGLGVAAAAMVFAGFPFMLAFAFGGGGGGDVKVMAAAGAILSFPDILPVMGHALAVGAFIALALTVFRGRLRQMTAGVVNMIMLLPFGVRQASGLKIAERDPATGMVIDADAPINRKDAVGVRFGVALFLAMLWLSLPGLPRLPGL